MILKFWISNESAGFYNLKIPTTAKSLLKSSNFRPYRFNPQALAFISLPIMFCISLFNHLQSAACYVKRNSQWWANHSRIARKVFEIQRFISHQVLSVPDQIFVVQQKLTPDHVQLPVSICSFTSLWPRFICCHGSVSDFDFIWVKIS